ncbi:site-specific integrase [Rhodococcus sp. KRD162]|uniref:site-specific integrase n=1 Tax=Rhodococcus sp. KRD162 TaxID=2729725 RepID=UPI003D0090D4
MVDFVGSPPWQWSPHDADEFFAHLRGVRNLSHATIRAYQSDVRLFLEYATNPVYEWNENCGRLFGTVWLGPQVEVQCLCEFRVREWTQEEIHESWHADTPPSRSSPKSGRARKCSMTDARWSRSSRSFRSPRRLGTAG